MKSQLWETGVPSSAQHLPFLNPHGFQGQVREGGSPLWGGSLDGETSQCRLGGHKDPRLGEAEAGMSELHPGLPHG